MDSSIMEKLSWYTTNYASNLTVAYFNANIKCKRKVDCKTMKTTKKFLSYQYLFRQDILKILVNLL